MNVLKQIIKADAVSTNNEQFHYTCFVPIARGGSAGACRTLVSSGQFNDREFDAVLIVCIRTSAACQPLRHDMILFALANCRAVEPKREFLARENRPAMCHVQNPQKLIRYVPDYAPGKILHGQPSSGNTTCCFSGSSVEVAGTGFEPATSRL